MTDKNKNGSSPVSLSPRWSVIIFAIVAFVIAAWAVQYFNGQPGYTDAFYHYNGAVRLAHGDGFIEDYLWTYQGAPASLPAPSHLYWMPGTSILASIGISVFGTSYGAAQAAFIACLWGASLIAYALGLIIGGTGRHAWAAGVITLSGGYFLRMYGVIDTFAPYAFFGAAALFAQGWARQTSRVRPWIVAGALAAAGHLIRTDGLLLVVVGVLAALWPIRRVDDENSQQKMWHATSLRNAGIFLFGYLVIMTPWFARNLFAIGTILPTGGTQAVWYLSYDELFNYPPRINPLAFTVGGIQLLINARLETLRPTLETFIAVEGMVVLVPLMLIALWKRCKQPFYQPFIMFVIGIHLAFWLLFPFPGVRGGLFHAAAALIPWWAALGMTGIDDIVKGIARRRRHWNARTAARLFTVILLLGVAYLSWIISAPRRITPYILPLYTDLKAALPSDTRIMINDPSQLYYYTGLGGVTFPNEPPETILTIAEVYDIDYVVVEGDSWGNLAVPAPMVFDLDDPPPFLREVPHDVFHRGEARLYEIVREPQ